MSKEVPILHEHRKAVFKKSVTLLLVVAVLFWGTGSFAQVRRPDQVLNSGLLKPNEGKSIWDDTSMLKSVFFPLHFNTGITVNQYGLPLQFTDKVIAYKGIGIGTKTPDRPLHLAMPSVEANAQGIMAKITDTRTTGKYRISGLQLETNTNTSQVLNMTGDGLAFEPFNSLSGIYLRNLTPGGGAFITTNKGGKERKTLTLTGDSVGIGWGHIIRPSPYVYPNMFGGMPTIIGIEAEGNGVAVGFRAKATNYEATALGPQASADCLACIAIGDGAKATANVWEGNLSEGGSVPAGKYGNQIVLGDAAYTRGNVNFFIGGGAGIDHDFVIALGAAGSSTSYNSSVSTADHQGYLGWYQHDSPYFTGGMGFVNDWWLGGPRAAQAPHDISLNMTSAWGTDRNGINFRIVGSRGTGSGNPGDIIFMTGNTTASGNTLQDSVARFTIRGNGKLQINTTPDSTGLVTGGYLFRDAATGEIQLAPAPSLVQSRAVSMTESNGSVRASLHVVNDTNYTVSENDYTILVVTATAQRTLVLPPAAANANRVLIIGNNTNNMPGKNDVILSEPVKNSPTWNVTNLQAGQRLTIQSDGTNWWIISTLGYFPGAV